MRGLGAEVTYAQYPGTLPHGLTFGEGRAAVRKRLGKSTWSRDENERWTFGDRVMTVTFKKRSDTVCEVEWAMPRSFNDDGSED